MSFAVRAITLDLDDTLWPFAPIGARIERVLDDWLRRHSPATAERFPIEAMRTVRQQMFDDHPQLAHDLGRLRRMTIEHALRESGGDLALADAAYDLFYAERNRVDFYDDALDALERIAARVPVMALSNGNADLAVIGIDALFVDSLPALQHGAGKPDPGIFHAACERLGVARDDVLHVGDHVEIDVVGAMQAGLRGCWINRVDAQWPEAHPAPDLQFTTLAALADWLDAQPAAAPESAQGAAA